MTKNPQFRENLFDQFGEILHFLCYLNARIYIVYKSGNTESMYDTPSHYRAYCGPKDVTHQLLYLD